MFNLNENCNGLYCNICLFRGFTEIFRVLLDQFLLKSTLLKTTDFKENLSGGPRIYEFNALSLTAYIAMRAYTYIVT